MTRFLSPEFDKLSKSSKKALTNFFGYAILSRSLRNQGFCLEPVWKSHVEHETSEFRAKGVKIEEGY